MQRNLPSLEGHPENLTNDHIKKIGESYTNRYGEQPLSGWMSLYKAPHTNHPIANTLINYNEPTEPFEKWYFLADQYAELPNNNGNLAKELRRLFKKSFKQKVRIEAVDPHMAKYAGFTLPLTKQPISLDTETVSLLMKGMVDHYYLEQYRQNERLKNDKQPANKL